MNGSRFWKTQIFYTSAGEYELRPPATTRQIAECEQFIGRSFSPSYRHFLRLHDGWKGFYSSAGIGYLYGTHHLRYDEAAREDFSIAVWAHLQASRPTDPLDVPDHTNDIYLPENFYRFLDTQEPVVQELQPLKDMLVDEQVQEFLSELIQMMLGAETHYQLFLDMTTLQVMEKWKWSNGQTATAGAGKTFMSSCVTGRKVLFDDEGSIGMSDTEGTWEALGLSAALADSYAQDARGFLPLLAGFLQAALPGVTTIERKGGLFQKVKPIHKITVTLGEDVYTLEDTGRGAPVTQRTKIVRGIRLKTEAVLTDQWLAALSAEIERHAHSNEAAFFALRELLHG